MQSFAATQTTLRYYDTTLGYFKTTLRGPNLKWRAPISTLKWKAIYQNKIRAQCRFFRRRDDARAGDVRILDRAAGTKLAKSRPERHFLTWFLVKCEK